MDSQATKDDQVLHKEMLGESNQKYISKSLCNLIFRKNDFKVVQCFFRSEFSGKWIDKSTYRNHSVLQFICRVEFKNNSVFMV